MRRIFFNTSIILAVLIGTSRFAVPFVSAAQFTGVKDTMSTQAISTPAIHTINNTLVGGDTFATGETLTYDFIDADFTLNAIANWQTTDFSFNDGTARTIIAVSTTSGVAPTCTAGTNNVGVTINTTTNTFTVTACGSYAASSANAAITFIINGTTATGTGTMTNKSSDVNSSIFSITESNTDTASGAVIVETNAVVTVTATVNPTLTFANDDASVGFGALSSSAATYANGAGTGSSSVTTANTFTIGTNATSGYSLTYNGATLTSNANTIAPATITGSATGTTGSAQFGLDATVTGTGTATTAYNAASNNWKFLAATTDQIASATGPVASDTVAMRYLANIPASQPAGNYSTTLTYVLTGNF